MSKVLGWHFSNGSLAYGDDRKIVAGKLYTVKKPIVLCNHGLHASVRAIDALAYAPGSIISRVELSGEVIEGDDKVVASRRKVIAVADASKVLHRFATDVAADAVLALKNPDPRLLEAIRVKRLWIEGKATDEELSAARSAAVVAAESAAWSAAESAAWSAARSAANIKLEHALSDLLGV